MPEQLTTMARRICNDVREISTETKVTADPGRSWAGRWAFCGTGRF